MALENFYSQHIWKPFSGTKYFGLIIHPLLQYYWTWDLLQYIPCSISKANNLFLCFIRLIARFLVVLILGVCVCL
jgi:hypothetical protein